MSPTEEVIYYPIAGSPKGGALYLYGEKSAGAIIILCAGFPDDQEAFAPFAKRLSEDTDSFVGVTTMPGYHGPIDQFKKEGFTFDEMEAAIREAAKMLKQQSTYEQEGNIEKKKTPLKTVGIFHDWGVIPGSMWANRLMEDDENRTLKLVLFDVLLGPHPFYTGKIPPPNECGKASFYQKLIDITYKSVLGSGYLLQRYLPGPLAKFIFGLEMTLLSLFRLSPTLAIDQKTFEARKTPLELGRMMFMAYPYVEYLQRMFFKGFDSSFSIPKDLKKTPVLYMYGTAKRMMFHDHKSLRILEREEEEKRSKTKAIAVKGAGHWLYSETQRFDFCLESVKKFIFEEE